MTTYFESDRRELRAALRSITELVIENDRLKVENERLKEFIRELEIALGRELN